MFSRESDWFLQILLVLSKYQVTKKFEFSFVVSGKVMKIMLEFLICSITHKNIIFSRRQKDEFLE